MDLRSQPHVKDRGKLGTRIAKPAAKMNLQEPSYHQSGPPITSLSQGPQYHDPSLQQYTQTSGSYMGVPQQTPTYSTSQHTGFSQPLQQPSRDFSPPPQHSGGFGQHSGDFAQQPQHSGGFAQQPHHSGGFAQQPQHSGGFAQQPQHAGGFGPPQHSGGFAQQPMGGFGEPGAYNQPGSGLFNQPQAGFSSALLQDPMMANMALNYGQNILGQGREKMEEKLGQYVSVSQLKYYFAVDTNYVMKKLGLLYFPFMHKDWSIRYNNENPVQPRYEVNAPDLYIPVMAFVTYILASGLMLGIQQRFSPEDLGVQASSALVWLILELAVISLTIYVCNIKTQLSTYHLLAICSYKFVGMITSLAASLLFASTGYYAALSYCSISLAFFMVRSLKTIVLCERSDDTYQSGRKRSMYLLFLIGGLQPVMMFWLTWKMATFQTSPAVADVLS